MPKRTYRVRNWSEYNRGLINRGRITLWFDKNTLKNWYEPVHFQTKRGRAKLYSDLAILSILTIKQIFHLTFRSAKGFTESIFKLMDLDIKVPCWTRLCRRQSGVRLPRLPKRNEPIHMVIDSTGLKIFGEGEWKVRQHGWSKHRMWRKLHLGVDEDSNLIVSALLTGNDCGDDKKLPELLRQYKGGLKQVSADGAYDSHACYDEIVKYGAIPTIPPQPNPKHKPKTIKEIKRPRDKIVWRIQNKGRVEWKKESGYHRRSLAETAYYRLKRIFGDKLFSRKLENQQAEALIRCHALNKMTLRCAMPNSKAY